METETGDHPLSFKMDDRDYFFGDKSSSKQPTLFTAEVKGNLEIPCFPPLSVKLSHILQSENIKWS
jgi:hypothetical protein